jgi:hypothetical protein
MSEVAEQAAPAEGAQNPGNEAQAEGAEGTEAQTAAENPQKRGESDKDYELRLSKLTRESRMARADAEKYKSAATKNEAELKELRAQLEKHKGPRKLTVSQYRDLVRKANEGWGDPAKMAELFDSDDGTAQLPKEVLDKIAAVEKRQREIEERDRLANQDREIKRQLQVVREDVLQPLIDSGECPLFEVFPGYAVNILKAIHQEWKEMGSLPNVEPDSEAIAKKFHDGLAAEIHAALKSPKTRSFLFAAVPELKALAEGHEVRAGSPTSEHQGAAVRNSPAAKASQPTVSRKPEPKKKLERYEQDEARVQATLDAYEAYRLAVRNGKA